MAQPLPNQFQQFDLTEEEDIQGKLLSVHQKYVLQNMLADAAKEKLSLVDTRKDFDQFWQRQAELTGQIGILQLILSNAELASEQVREFFQRNPNQE